MSREKNAMRAESGATNQTEQLTAVRKHPNGVICDCTAESLIFWKTATMIYLFNVFSHNYSTKVKRM